MPSFPSSLSWQQTNQQYLADSLAEVKACLAQHIRNVVEDTPTHPAPVAETAHSPAAHTGKQPSSASLSALERLSLAFCLSSFEQAILLLCAGVELDSHFAALCAQAQGDAQRSWPTFSLALACLPNAHWGALAPDAPLRRWRLIELTTQNGLTQSQLRIDERILHYLTGTNSMDARLRPLLQRVLCEDDMVSSHQAIAAQIAAAWQRSEPSARLPLVQLCGSETLSKRVIAASACALTGRELYLLTQAALPTTIAELETLIDLWEREARLGGLALMLDCEVWEGNGAAHADAVTWLADQIAGPLLLTVNERRPMRYRPMLTFDIARPTLAEQQELWKSALATLCVAQAPPSDAQASPDPAACPCEDADLETHIARLTAQFDVGASTIRAAGLTAMVQEREASSSILSPSSFPSADHQPSTTNHQFSTVWNACRNLARPRLDDLAQRISAVSAWEDLILPVPQRQILQNIVAHVRQRSTVYQTWGFTGRSGRGLGISALFAGPSGTGKTTAAEALAGELHLDLYRIDLSGVVSKYIGESEKNLRRVFDAAEEGGVILLFDEADALFGKRSEVKDSHDRYANLGVSYLLQRMESYRGLAILTTNLPTALDTAFLRRIRFIVQFPFPDAAQRREIWQRVFPAQTPTRGLDARRLAQLDVSGGTIRNIALNAAFVAADAGEIVQMHHVLRAAQIEYAKLNKSLTAAETAGWLD